MDYLRIHHRAVQGTEEGLIGVHCTHGLNRTGYLICRYEYLFLDSRVQSWCADTWLRCLVGTLIKQLKHLTSQEGTHRFDCKATDLFFYWRDSHRKELTTCITWEPKDGKQEREGFPLDGFFLYFELQSFLKADFVLAGVDRGRDLKLEKMENQVPWTKPASSWRSLIAKKRC